ncbi:response regulator [Butyrivibrio sp. AE2032]|uniref:response regulator n=1 Tax=Butyrivibrio sp. AE2032 TaxID=1458463 RepID=UPI00068E0CD5|nr:transporter substrate-binding domain-containing protein [Butyrivibrio sp. AE2032]
MNVRKHCKSFGLSMLILCACLFFSGFIGTIKAYATTGHENVKVGYFENEIFQEGAEEGAVRKGYAYEYYLKLSEYTGWEYEYVFGSFSELYQMLLDGEIDLLAGLAYTDERKDIVGYPKLPMGSETYNMVKHASDDSITTSPASLENKKIAVLDSAMVGVLNEFLEDHDITAIVEKYPSYKEMLEDFDKGNTDAFVAESDGSADRPNAELLYAFGSNDYYLCVNVKRQDLLKELDVAQEQLMIEEPNYINSLKIKYYPSSISSRSFSDDEKEWLSKHNELRIGYLSNYLPYSDVDDEGQATGLVKELVPLMLDELGIQDLSVNYMAYDNYDDMIKAIGAEEIDVAFPVGGGLYYSEENDIYQSSPVVSSNTMIIYGGEYSAEKLKSFALNENNRMQYYFVKSNYPDAETTYYKSIYECLDAVLTGKVGCTTLNGLQANDMLKNRRYRNLNIKQQSVMDDRCFGVHLGDAGLLKLLNRALNIIGTEQTQNMAYKYVDGLYKDSFLDNLQDNMWFVVLIILVFLFVVVLFLLRENSVSRKRAIEREEAGKVLEEKNAQLAEAVKEAEEASKAKDYFLSTMSHDIRTPMNSILSMNEMVMRECDNENVLEYSGHIKSSGKTLLGLINDILDFSKIQAGKLDIIPVEYEMSSVLNDLVTMASAMAEEKGLLFELNVDSDLPNYLKGDETRIKQAVTNIITNAVKYTKEGTVTFTLGYDKIPDEPNAVILKVSVKDTGVGIKEEEIGKLFDAFERLDKKNNRNVEGTGLGITITQRLLNLMGSSMEVESTYGVGSTFSFDLKQEVIKWDGVGDFEAAFRKSITDRKKYKERFTAPDAKILVVDDTLVNLKVFCNLLKRTNMQIDAAESADEGLEFTRQKKYDLIFFDHMMPYKDGIEALQELKAEKENPNRETPIICLTANAISGMREMYLNAGFDDYVTKPIDPAILEEAIIKYLPKDIILSQESFEETREEAQEPIIPEFMYQIEGLDVDGAVGRLGSEEIYLETAKTYQETVDKTASDIEKYWEKKNIPNLTTKVHAIKSTSRIIGAMELGDFAEVMEDAGRNNDESFLSKNIQTLLNDYRKLGKNLESLTLEQSSSDNARQLSIEELQGIYEQLRKAVDNADYNVMDELAEALSNCNVPESEAGRVKEIVRAISDFDYDDVLSYVK